MDIPKRRAQHGDPVDDVEILTVPEDNGGPTGFIPTAEVTVPEEEATAEGTVIEEELPAEPSPESGTDALFEEQPLPAAAEEETASAAPAEEVVREQTEAE